MVDRLYCKGRVLGYERAKRNQNPNVSLIQVEGVQTTKDAQFYLGKRVAYVYRAQREVNGSKIRVIWGRIARTHGTNGVVKARFRKNLPPKVFGASVRVVNYQKVNDVEYFHQPLLQTTMIFLGEMICILIIHLVTKTPSLLDRSMLEAVQPHHSYGNDWVVPQTSVWSAAWFILPSACDLIATTLLNLGLIYTTPSIYQMVKSSIVGFSAIFSCLFLSRKFLRKEWAAILCILVGTGAIIWSAYKESLTENFWGPVFLIVAQLFVAGQFILEEYLMDRYHLDPVRAMGIEGVFGTILLSTALTISAFFGRDILDVRQGFQQLFGINVLWQSALLLSFMVAIFNFFGLAVSTTVGIPGRSMIDSLR
ncbi:hypothetical protein G6F68_004246 [Rhizopus microsporus]|nr:hypothetical protein G6F68_004246 [Rhizopus microsporus]